MALILHARDTALRPASTNSCQWRYIELCLRIFRPTAEISGLLQNWLQVSWRRKILLNWLGTTWWNWIALSSRTERSASLRWWEWICVYLCVYRCVRTHCCRSGRECLHHWTCSAARCHWHWWQEPAHSRCSRSTDWLAPSMTRVCWWEMGQRRFLLNTWWRKQYWSFQWNTFHSFISKYQT